MFPETQFYLQYAPNSGNADYVIRSAIDKYSGTYLVLEAPTAYTEIGVIYAQKGLKR